MPFLTLLGFPLPARQTLERSYLLRINGKVVERPQHMLMRVSVGIHKDNLDAAVNTYHLMSERMFTHASPTLFNSGTPRPQLSSCFLVAMKVRGCPLLCVGSCHGQLPANSVLLSVFCYAVCCLRLPGARASVALTRSLHTTFLPRATQSCCVYALRLDATQNDSIEGIYDTLKECAVISKSAGEDQRVSAGRQGQARFC